jgi:hypothetical protein
MRRIIVSDFNKRLDEIAEEYTHLLSFGGEDFSEIKDIVKSAMLQAIDEFAKLEPNRKKFDDLILSSPYERSIERYGINASLYAWPGQYRDTDVQMVWEIVCAMLAAQVREIKEGK